MSIGAKRTVLETILDWSTDRPLWQRDAMRRIVTTGTPNATDLKEILALCKKGHGARDIDVEPAVLEAAH